MVRGFTAVLSVAVLVLAFVFATAAQAAPSNDAFSAPSPLTAGQQVSATNVDATAEAPDEPNPNGVAKSDACDLLSEDAECSASVWYAFEAPSSSEFTVETCDGGTEVDSVLGVYTGATIGALTEVGSNDDGAGALDCPGGFEDEGSRVSFAATAGTLYRIDVNGFHADEGSFYLRLYPGAPVPSPTPDTSIGREGSFATAQNIGDNGRGMISGPRHTPSFLLNSAPPGASFECSLDGGAYSSCARAVSYEGLAPGSSHTFAARAVSGGVTDPTPVIQRFTIDTAPPETTLLSGPTGELALPEAEWVAAGSERLNESNRFLCGVDGELSEACSASSSFTELCKGPHDFRSAAFDKAANVDPSPVTAHVLVTTGAIECSAPELGVSTVAEIGPTSADLQYSVDDKGAGGTLTIEYGPTSSYGTTVRESIDPSVGFRPLDRFMRYLDPNTEYHLRYGLSTPFGAVSSEDITFKTEPLGSRTIPTVANGTPTASAYAAAVPATIDGAGKSADFGLLITPNGPVTLASPAVENDGTGVDGGAGPTPETILVADLTPSTTYHYRVAVEQNGPEATQALGPEGTFTTPPFVAVTSKTHFRLTRRNIKLGKLTRRSKVLHATVKGLPAGTVVRVRLLAGKHHIKARKKEKSKGRIRFSVHLSKKMRKSLHNPELKQAKIIFTASPPGDTTSKVVLKPKLKR